MGIQEYAGFNPASTFASPMNNPLPDYLKVATTVINQLCQEHKINGNGFFQSVANDIIQATYSEAAAGASIAAQLFYKSVDSSNKSILANVVGWTLLATHSYATSLPGQPSNASVAGTFRDGFLGMVTLVALDNGLQNYMANQPADRISYVEDQVKVGKGVYNAARNFMNQANSGAVHRGDSLLQSNLNAAATNPITALARRAAAGAARAEPEYTPIDHGPGKKLKWFPSALSEFFFSATDYLSRRIVQTAPDKFTVINLIEDVSSVAEEAISMHTEKAINMDEALHRIYAMEIGSVNVSPEVGERGPLAKSAIGNDRLKTFLTHGILNRSAIDFRNGYVPGGQETPEGLWNRESVASVLEVSKQFNVAKHEVLQELLSYPMMANKIVNAFTKTYRVLKVLPIGFQTDGCMERIQREIINLDSVERALHWGTYRDSGTFFEVNRGQVTRMMQNIQQGNTDMMEYNFHPVIPGAARKVVSDLMTNLFRHRINMQMSLSDEVESAQLDYPLLSENYFQGQYPGNLGVWLAQVFNDDNKSHGNMSTLLDGIFKLEKEDAYYAENKSGDEYTDIELLVANRLLLSSSSEVRVVIEKAIHQYHVYLQQKNQKEAAYNEALAIYKKAEANNVRRIAAGDAPISIVEPVAENLPAFDFVFETEAELNIYTAAIEHSRAMNIWRNRSVVLGQNISITAVRFTIGELGVLLFPNMSVLVGPENTETMYVLMKNILEEYDGLGNAVSQHFLITADGSVIEFGRSIVDTTGNSIVAMMGRLPIIEM